MAFHILHISDIHFSSDTTHEWITRKRIIDRIRNNALEADCIIISGDLFHKGALQKNAAAECKEFIDNLKEVSKRKVGNTEQEQYRKPMVIAVPGNHDLDRFARKEENDAYNVFVRRSDIVNDAGRIILNDKNVEILSDDYKAVLYQLSFDAFQRFAKVIGSETFCTPNAFLSRENYEVQRYFLRSIGNEGSVQFVLLNTALFSGQSLNCDEFKLRRTKLEQKHKIELEAGKKVQAAMTALQIAQEQEAYETFGGFVVDEEKEDNKNGRLGLSREGDRFLTTIIPEDENGNQDIICTIFVGHHGLEFLSRQTLQAISNAVDNCSFSNEGIYLCGHAHQARCSEYTTSAECKVKRINQAQAGVLFGGDDSFAEYGFNYISIDDKKTTPNITVTSHYLEKKPSGRKGWRKQKLFEVQLPVQMEPQQGLRQDNTIGKESVIEEYTKVTNPQETNLFTHQLDGVNIFKSSEAEKPRVPSMDEMLGWLKKS